MGQSLRIQDSIVVECIPYYQVDPSILRYVGA